MTDGHLVGFHLLVTYGYMALWIALSSGVILLNKYILYVANFPYPVALTCTHMLFSSVLAYLIVHLRFTEVVHVSADTYIRCVLPISVLFAVTLWLSNASYLYLSVSFIQMVKASMPLIVFTFGVLFRVERFTLRTTLTLIVVVFGVSLASYGELNFVLTGFLLLIGSLLAEAVRLNLIQILLQHRGIRLNPISTLYHIAPCCFVLLVIPFLYIELPRIVADPDVEVNVPLLLGSALAAFALNMSIFMLIGRTSALTMNVAGVVKDWLLIILSVFIYASPVTRTQIFGYGIAFVGVMYYNYAKIQEAALRAYKANKTSLEEGGGNKGSLPSATSPGADDSLGGSNVVGDSKTLVGGRAERLSRVNKSSEGGGGGGEVIVEVIPRSLGDSAAGSMVHKKP